MLFLLLFLFVFPSLLLPRCWNLSSSALCTCRLRFGIFPQICSGKLAPQRPWSAAPRGLVALSKGNKRFFLHFLFFSKFLCLFDNSSFKFTMINFISAVTLLNRNLLVIDTCIILRETLLTKLLESALKTLDLSRIKVVAWNNLVFDFFNVTADLFVGVFPTLSGVFVSDTYRIWSIFIGYLALNK